MGQMAMAQAVIFQTTGLKKHFGGVKAVDGVNLAIPRGELRAIIGPNGAGKTTLFNLLTGHIRHDAGAIYFKGEEISKSPPHHVSRKGIGRTFQITSIFRRMTALENVQVALMTHRLAWRPKASGVSDRLGRETGPPHVG